MTRAPHSAVAIDAALQRGDAALIAYLPVGFPSVEDSIRAGKVLADCGVDVIELGFPYSDPGMDGPTIQRATVAALERGTHLEDLFHAVDELTSYGISTCSMTYWNPVEWWGVERFAKDFAAVGGSGLITPDLPPEEGAQRRLLRSLMNLRPPLPLRADFLAICKFSARKKFKELLHRIPCLRRTIVL